MLGETTADVSTAHLASTKSLFISPSLASLLLLEDELIGLGETSWVVLIDFKVHQLFKVNLLIGSETILSKQIYLNEDLHVKEL